MKRSLLLSLCATAVVAMSLGQAMAAVTLSLNLRYNDPNNEAAGGTWDLLASTDSAFGISAVVADIDGISNPSLNSGISVLFLSRLKLPVLLLSSSTVKTLAPAQLLVSAKAR